MDTLARLKSLYRQLDSNAAAGEDVVADLRKEINNLELTYLKDRVFPDVANYLGAKIKDLRCEIDCSLQFSEDSKINYSFCTSGSGLLIKDSVDAQKCEVASGNNLALNSQTKAVYSIYSSANVSSIEKESIDFNVSKIESESNRTKAKPIGIKSIKSQHIFVNEGNATKKFIDFINHIGPELVYDMHINYLGGPLVDLHPNPKYESACRRLDGGFWININSSTHTKISQIKRICANLGMSVDIELDSDEPKNTNVNETICSYPESTLTSSKNGRTYYSLNGGEPLTKRRAVLEAVKLFVKENPKASFQQIKTAFPGNLQGSYGVVAELKYIQLKNQLGRNFSDRYFLDEKDILTSGNGVRFAVCNQWGNQFIIFQRYVSDKFGWTLEPVNSSKKESTIVPNKNGTYSLNSNKKPDDKETTLFSDEIFEDSNSIEGNPQKEASNQEDIVIKDYSNRFIIVYGDTEPLSKLFSVCGGSFNPALEDGSAWLFPKYREDDVRKIVSKHQKSNSKQKSKQRQESKPKKENKEQIEEFKFYLIANGTASGKNYSYFTVQEFGKLLTSDYIINVVKKFNASGDLFEVTDEEILQEIYDVVNYDCKYKMANIKYWHAISAYRRFVNSQK